jgi:hypothetical protein
MWPQGEEDTCEQQKDVSARIGFAVSKVVPMVALTISLVVMFSLTPSMKSSLNDVRASDISRANSFPLSIS